MHADPKKPAADLPLVIQDVREMNGRPQRSTTAHIEDALDDALRGTFPASDPVAVHATVREVERTVARMKVKRRAAKQRPVKARSKKKTGKKKTGKKKLGKKRPSRRRRT